MSELDNSSPNENNCVEVMIGADPHVFPPILSLYVSGWLTTEIDFDKDKKFIRFTFPSLYADFDIRVFETSEAAGKTTIMDAYTDCPTTGVADFNQQWGGEASSNGEFKVYNSKDQTLTIRDKDTDSTNSNGTLHTFILKYKFDGTYFLYDPSIRNKN